MEEDGDWVWVGFLSPKAVHIELFWRLSSLLALVGPSSGFSFPLHSPRRLFLLINVHQVHLLHFLLPISILESGTTTCCLPACLPSIKPPDSKRIPSSRQFSACSTSFETSTQKRTHFAPRQTTTTLATTITWKIPKRDASAEISKCRGSEVQRSRGAGDSDAGVPECRGSARSCLEAKTVYAPSNNAQRKRKRSAKPAGSRKDHRSMDFNDNNRFRSAELPRNRASEFRGSGLGEPHTGPRDDGDDNDEDASSSSSDEEYEKLDMASPTLSVVHFEPEANNLTGRRNDRDDDDESVAELFANSIIPDSQPDPRDAKAGFGRSK
ncbi:hypothetical protein V8F33_003072 [Rhypophila sp. PSN 637]